MVLLCLAANHAAAQSASVQSGARAHGIGYASGCLSDVWSATNNIAGLAEIQRPSIGVSFHAVPFFTSFNRMAAAVGVPLAAGAAGAAVFRFGDDLYSEQVVTVGYANTLGLAALGAKLNYIQYRATGLPGRHAITLSFGGIASLTPQLLVGAHIVNINQPVINELTGEQIPTRLIAGLAFKSSENLFVAAEIEKDLAYSPVWKAGIEYVFIKKIAFRTGFNFNPEKGFLGLGFTSRKLQLDYCLEFNDPLGLQHQATITWQFQQP